MKPCLVVILATIGVGASSLIPYETESNFEICTNPITTLTTPSDTPQPATYDCQPEDLTGEPAGATDVHFTRHPFTGVIYGLMCNRYNWIKLVQLTLPKAVTEIADVTGVIDEGPDEETCPTICFTPAGEAHFLDITDNEDSSVLNMMMLDLTTGVATKKYTITLPPGYQKEGGDQEEHGGSCGYAPNGDLFFTVETDYSVGPEYVDYDFFFRAPGAASGQNVILSLVNIFQSGDHDDNYFGGIAVDWSTGLVLVGQEDDINEESYWHVGFWVDASCSQATGANKVGAWAAYDSGENIASEEFQYITTTVADGQCTFPATYCVGGQSAAGYVVTGPDGAAVTNCTVAAAGHCAKYTVKCADGYTPSAGMEGGETCMAMQWSADTFNAASGALTCTLTARDASAVVAALSSTEGTSTLLSSCGTTCAPNLCIGLSLPTGSTCIDLGCLVCATTQRQGSRLQRGALITGADCADLTVPSGATCVDNADSPSSSSNKSLYGLLGLLALLFIPVLISSSLLLLCCLRGKKKGADTPFASFDPQPTIAPPMTLPAPTMACPGTFIEGSAGPVF